ncbi:hypothetical protein [Lentzea sp. NPDC003310]|uniref:hypothetical protein n=1 Tax=Lentzea sp. NPDC003310 TaxID=3154447 RepID=UPI0033AB3D65
MSDNEQRLVQAARDGEWLVGDVVRAGLVRELLLGRHGEIDPAGLRLDSVRVEGVLDLNRVKALAGLVFSNCVIVEPIKARYASLPDLVFAGGRCGGIHANGLQVDGDVFLRGGTEFAGDEPDSSTVRLIGARIGGDLELSGVRISNARGRALDAADLTVNGTVFLRDGTKITGTGPQSAVSLVGARIASSLELAEVEIGNATGPALSLDASAIGGMHLRRAVRITAHTPKSAVRLVSATISGHLELSDTRITNPAGIALDANGARVDGALLLRDEVFITAHSEVGAVDLVSSRIGTAFELAGTEIRNAAGAAITADRISVDGPLTVRGGTKLTAGGGDPALSLIGAHLRDRFACSDEVVLESTPALVLRDATVGTSVRLPHEALCPDRGRGPTCPHGNLVLLDDFTYSSLARWDWQEWLHVIRCHTPAYHASAYQRLAAVERAAGHDGTVRRILMAQQTDLRRRSPQSLGGRLTRWFHWLWGVLAGYGYRARRTAAALLLVLAVSGALGWWAGQVPTRPGHLAAERVSSAAPCSTVELIGLGLDRGLPLAMTGMRARCDLDTSSRKGQAFTAAIWLVQLAVWGLATLALAGYTNLVRKPG